MADHERKCFPLIPGHGENRVYVPPASRLDLPLLQACRQIYYEAADYLYSANIFDSNHPRNLLYLSRTVRPERLQLIRHFHTYWLTPLPLRLLPYGDDDNDEDTEWWGSIDLRHLVTFWTRLGHLLTHLAYVKVHIVRIDPSITWRRSDSWYQSLASIGPLRSFDLIINEDYKKRVGDEMVRKLERSLRIQLHCPAPSQGMKPENMRKKRCQRKIFGGKSQKLKLQQLKHLLESSTADKRDRSQEF